MNQDPARIDLASHVRRLLAAVKAAYGAERRGGWLIVPLALLGWISRRRISGQQAVALELFAGYLETVLLLLEDGGDRVVISATTLGPGRPRAPGQWRDTPGLRRALPPYKGALN